MSDVSCGMCRCCYARAQFMERKLTRDLAGALDATSEQWENAIEVAKAIVRERDELKEKVTQLELALAQERDTLSAHEASCMMLTKKSDELFHPKMSIMPWSSLGPSGSFGNNASGSQEESK